MSVKLDLPYGKRPYSVELAGRDVECVRPVELGLPAALDTLLQSAIDAPIGGPRLEGDRVTLLLSDPTRSEPREAFVSAIRRRLPHAHFTLAIATGTHGPCRIDELGLSESSLRDATIVNHDGHRDADLVELGTTVRGTPVRVHRCVIDTDLVIATGCIRPHYFAGFGAGVKALFPGMGQAKAIRINHQLKTEPGARAGIVVGNPCRDDLEEAARFVPTPVFLVNGVCAHDGLVHRVVAGDVVDAFRVGVEIARPWFTAKSRGGPVVIASDALPVTASLYQAAKIAAAVAPLVDPGGTLVVVAECADGIGPLDVVNEAIFRIGVLPRLAPGVRLVLVSSLDESEVRRTLLAFSPSVEDVLARVAGPVTVVPRASQLIYERN